MDMVREICDLLDKYNHINTEDGVRAVLTEWAKNKANLVAHLSQHPNWDGENFRIVFSSDYERAFDEDGVTEFKKWFRTEFARLNSETIDGVNPSVYRTNIRYLTQIQRSIESIREYENADFNSHMIFEYKGEDCSTLSGIISAMSEKYEQFYETHTEIDDYYVPENKVNELRKAISFFSTCMVNGTGVLTEETANTINEIFPELKAVQGQKMMKLVRKVCIKYGLDKIVDMKTEYFMDANGNVHNRTKDMGYNGQIAKLGDKVNPLKIRRHTIISVNPLDYLTMSFGYKWASCHTIDKENFRRVSNNHHHGMYCSGCMSYMLDESSVLFATFDPAFEETDFENADKMQRCMFHINEDGTVIVQGRVYPDGRDGGDKSFASQFRNIVQQIVAQCYGHNNLWENKKGTRNIREYVYSRGTHYRDYLNYEDCTISLQKGIDTYKTTNIGHTPICVSCGCEHTTEEWLTCSECRDERTCDYCGDAISEDDAIYCEDNGRVYCCPDCAERDDVHWCEDDDQWHDEYHCYRDDATCDWYSGDPEIETEDGHRYSCWEHAEDDGYRADDNGYWWPEDEVFYDENRGIDFHRDSDTVRTINGEYFVDAESAREAGYLDYEGEWYREEEMVPSALTGEMFPKDLEGAVHIEETDDWFQSATDAEAVGYVETADGWVKREEEVA